MVKGVLFVKSLIEGIIDWFYPFFRNIIPKETFRYGFTGGSNTALDIFLYYITYNFILNKQIVHLGFVAISPHIASFIIVFPITFTTGFLLSKYITFTGSQLHGRVQLVRYGVTVFICIILNYIFLKVFVDFFGIYPTVSKLLTTVVVTIFSYFSQKYFTFRISEQEIA
jgi:putative flippase GtrA